MANTQQGLSYALPPNSRILEKEHYKRMRSRNYRIWGSRCATIFGSGRKYAKGHDCKMPRKEPITLRADIYYLVWWSFSAWSSELQLFTLCICHPLYEYLWKVDFVARFPSSRRFSGKTVAYQELFYVVTLTASSAQPKRRLKRDSKQVTGVVSKTKTLNALHTFWQIYLPSFHDYWRGQTWLEWRYKSRSNLYDGRFINTRVSSDRRGFNFVGNNHYKDLFVLRSA